MLKKVFIKDFAIVDELEIHFQAGLNIITGETGAGKSIIVGAIGALLGEKLSATSIRTEAEKAIVEGEFKLPAHSEIINYLKKNDFEVLGDDLILRRELHQSGRSRAFVNDSPAKLDDLSNITDLLLDLHGQHSHQSLLRKATHIQFLDHYAGHDDLLSKVHEAYKSVVEKRKRLRELQKLQSEQLQRKELLEFQKTEIEKINPSVEEEAELLQDEKLLSNATKILEKSERITQLLYENDQSAITQITEALNLFSELKAYENSLNDMAAETENALYILDEVAKSLQSISGKIEIDPNRLDQVQERLAELAFLKKKYGPSLENVVSHFEKIKTDLEEVHNIDDRIVTAKQQWNEAVKMYSDHAVALSESRLANAVVIEETVPKLLSGLGMENTVFKIKIVSVPVENINQEVDTQSGKTQFTGIDEVEFFISTNPGQPLRELSQIASGGEISRIMLALKSTIAQNALVPILLFDEIDAGVSGRIAQAVGRKMRDLSKNHQILCITHLPQIASAGAAHFEVFKEISANSTRTTVRKLTDSEREQSIAKLLAGEQISENHLKSARELIEEAK